MIKKDVNIINIRYAYTLNCDIFIVNKFTELRILEYIFLWSYEKYNLIYINRFPTLHGPQFASFHFREHQKNTYIP